MSIKNNIENLKYLIPDYISGNINSHDRELLEKGFIEYPELKDLYHDFQNTLNQTGNLTDDNPPEYYWNNLLTNIHNKIDADVKPSFIKDISLIWKIVVPVAAVLLILILLRTFNTETEIVQVNENVQEEKFNKGNDNVIQEKNDQIAENKTEDNTIDEYYSRDIYNENFKLNLQDTNSSDYMLTDENNYDIINEILNETDYTDTENIYDEYETDYNSLNEEEKKDIIESINNIKI